VFVCLDVPALWVAGMNFHRFSPGGWNEFPSLLTRSSRYSGSGQAQTVRPGVRSSSSLRRSSCHLCLFCTLDLLLRAISFRSNDTLTLSLCSYRAIIAPPGIRPWPSPALVCRPRLWTDTAWLCGWSIGLARPPVGR
jgi:hypothetical protein